MTSRKSAVRVGRAVQAGLPGTSRAARDAGISGCHPGVFRINRLPWRLSAIVRSTTLTGHEPAAPVRLDLRTDTMGDILLRVNQRVLWNDPVVSLALFSARLSRNCRADGQEYGVLSPMRIWSRAWQDVTPDERQNRSAPPGVGEAAFKLFLELYINGISFGDIQFAGACPALVCSRLRAPATTPANRLLSSPRRRVRRPSPPDSALHTGAPTQDGRLFPDGIPSTCASPKSYPGSSTPARRTSTS